MSEWQQVSDAPVKTSVLVADVRRDDELEIKVGSMWGNSRYKVRVLFADMLDVYYEYKDGSRCMRTSSDFLREFHPIVTPPTCNGLTMEQFIEHAEKNEIERCLPGSIVWCLSSYNKNSADLDKIERNWEAICASEQEFRIKPKPVEKKMGWREYEVFARDGQYYFQRNKAELLKLHEAQSIVGFGGVKYKGYIWYGNGFLSFDETEKHPIPEKVRFHEEE